MKLILLFSVGLVFLSCGGPSPVHFEESQSLALVEGNDFKTIKNAILTPYCISCHQQYKTYDGVKRELDEITSSIDSGRMPKRGPELSEELKTKLREWISAGAPSGDDTPPPDEVYGPNWKKVSQKIFIPKCLICHNPEGQAKFLDLSSRQVIFNARNRLFEDDRKLIDIEEPDKSYLIHVILDEDEPMPPKWSNISTLSHEDVILIKEWISLGLP